MKKKVVCKPSKWTTQELERYKMTLGKEYEVLQEDEAGYQIIKDNGDEFWFYKDNFDVVNVKTPCPFDWQPAEGYIVSDYEAECIDSQHAFEYLTAGKIYLLGDVERYAVSVITNKGNNGVFNKMRFATPTLRAGSNPKQPEQITLTGEDVKAIAESIDNAKPPSENLKDAQVRYDLFKDNQKEPLQSEYVPNSLKVRCLGDVISGSGKILTSDDIYSVISINREFGIEKYEIECDNGRLELFTPHHFEIVTDYQSIENIEKLDADPVNHPSHYTDGGIETIDFIEAKQLDYYTGNAVKYISRAGKKDPSKEVQDLEKAIWYLKRKVEQLKAAQDGQK